MKVYPIEVDALVAGFVGIFGGLQLEKIVPL